MSIEELKRLAEAASDVNWMHLCRENPVVFSGKYASYITAANPAAVLELIAEVEALRANATGLEHQLRESRQNDYHAMSYLPDCRTCANRGHINGLSQETYCDSCMWYGAYWKKNHYSPMQEPAP